MASVRLHHPTFASCNYAVELLFQPMPSDARACFACSQPDKPLVHKYKTLHLRLDSNGDVFVAPGILKLLKKVPTMAGFQIVDGRNAPPQKIGAIELPPTNTIFAERQFYIPGRSLAKSVDAMRKPFQPMVESIREKIDRAATKEKMKKSSTFILGRRKD